jgi:sulfatase modifying factor 1
MHGNAWEWCSNFYGDYPVGAVSDPTGPANGPFRVDRGGGWDSDASYCRSAVRYGGAPDGRSDSLGFRVAVGR